MLCAWGFRVHLSLTDLGFDRTRPYFGQLILQNRGHLGSRCMPYFPTCLPATLTVTLGSIQPETTAEVVACW